MTTGEDDDVQTRPAVRIICVDGGGRVLLIRWRDTVTGRVFWEPPGGGIEGDETPLDTARRELHEETGLAPDAVLDVSIPVERDSYWLGRRFKKIEPFFLAHFDGEPRVAPAAFTPEEDETFVAFGWHTLDEIGELDDLEPPDLLAAIILLLDRAA
ncbi:NUDIX domain-containing protein [Actinomadura rudentiformis]|uniref:NUDIX domain-containing protein n=1 Tax=Actinomadura rudentiformis TaxID=359158 RepID=UPI001CEF8C0F|nr:NUDIX hydrolase [Actinomadura rudentiformis]